MTIYVDRQLRANASMTQAYQNLTARKVSEARAALHTSPTKTSPAPVIDYQACSRPWEPLFARTLGETEDLAAACKAANCTLDQAEKALRNPSVCSLAQEAHKAACEKLLPSLRAQLPAVRQLRDRLEQEYTLYKSRHAPRYCDAEQYGTFGRHYNTAQQRKSGRYDPC